MVTEYCDQYGITGDQPKDSSVLSQSISINDVINLTKLHSWHNQWHRVYGSTGLRVYGPKNYCDQEKASMLCVRMACWRIRENC